MPQEIVTDQPSALSSLSAPAQQRVREAHELAKVIGSSREVLARAKAVFPLDLFPDTVTVDRHQITITHRWFFLMGATTSIRVEDILNVEATVGPFFGSLNIATRFFDGRRGHQVRKLWRWDATRLQAIIQGLVVAARRDIDTTAFDRRELVDGLTEVGATPNDPL